MTMKHSIETIQIEGQYKIIIKTPKDNKMLEYLLEGLELFFEEYEKYKLRNRSKKETNHGYLSVSGSDNLGRK